MNINITPSAVAVDTAANLLAFLELAKDPGKLKAVIDQIKSAQDAVQADVEQAKAIQAQAAALAADADKKAAKADKDLASAAIESRRAAQAVAEADAARGAMRAERTTFDEWMAAEREAIANLRARVDSDADANKRFASEVAEQSAALSAKEKEVAQAQAAADAMRAEYEHKLAGLKAMVG